MLLAGGQSTDPTLEAQMREHFSEAEIRTVLDKS